MILIFSGRKFRSFLATDFFHVSLALPLSLTIQVGENIASAFLTPLPHLCSAQFRKTFPSALVCYCILIVPLPPHTYLPSRGCKQIKPLVLGSTSPEKRQTTKQGSLLLMQNQSLLTELDQLQEIIEGRHWLAPCLSLPPAGGGFTSGGQVTVLTQFTYPSPISGSLSYLPSLSLSFQK